MPKIKLNYPMMTVVEATLRGHLPPKPGDIVMVFDTHSCYITYNHFTILITIDKDQPEAPFVATMSADTSQVFHWTHAYKVPKGYASVEA